MDFHHSTPLLNNVSHRCKRFKIVDSRRAASKTMAGWKGWSQPGLAALALQGFDQSRFLTTDVGTGTAMDMNITGEVGTLDVLPQPAFLFGLGNGVFQAARLLFILAANINIGFARSAGICANRHAFKDLMRINIDQDAILER